MINIGDLRQTVVRGKVHLSSHTAYPDVVDYPDVCLLDQHRAPDDLYSTQLPSPVEKSNSARERSSFLIPHPIPLPPLGEGGVVGEVRGPLLGLATNGRTLAF